MFEDVKLPPVGNTSVHRHRVMACIGQHIGDRREQQDRAGVFFECRSEGCILAVVADGMGGMTGGALAAEQVVRSSRLLFQDFNPRHDSVKELLANIVREAHTVIKLTAVTSEQQPHSTFVALVLQEGRADWAHVGDSRLYYFRGEELTTRTIDHSYVEHLIKRGEITREEGKNHKMGHVLTKALGGDKQPKPTFGEVGDLERGDAFLLCTDGLWHYFSEPELEQIVGRLAVRPASEILIEQARERAQGRGDNCTLALLKVQELIDSEENL